MFKFDFNALLKKKKHESNSTNASCFLRHVSIKHQSGTLCDTFSSACKRTWLMTTKYKEAVPHGANRQKKTFLLHKLCPLCSFGKFFWVFFFIWPIWCRNNTPAPQIKQVVVTWCGATVCFAACRLADPRWQQWSNLTSPLLKDRLWKVPDVVSTIFLYLLDGNAFRFRMRANKNLDLSLSKQRKNERPQVFGSKAVVVSLKPLWKHCETKPPALETRLTVIFSKNWTQFHQTEAQKSCTIYSTRRFENASAAPPPLKLTPLQPFFCWSHRHTWSTAPLFPQHAA